MTSVKKGYFDILLVVPLEEELLEVQKVFPPGQNHSTATTFRFEVETGDPTVTMLMVQQEAMGKTAAYHAVVDAAAEFDFSLVVCLGIAGSLTGDLGLCDVCYSEGVIDVYDNSKTSDSAGGGTDIALSPTFLSSPQPLVAALNFMRTFPDLRAVYAAWQGEREALAAALFPSEVIGRKGAPETIRAPKSRNGKIVCAAVSKGETYNNKLRGIDRKVMAIETESGGVFEAAARAGLKAVTFRGISDHADAAKDQLESTTGGKIRAFAAENAASFLRLQFGNPNFRDAIHRLRSERQLDLDLAGPQSVAKPRSLASVIGDLATAIDEKLREFSPEYRLLEKGYRLPVPRLRSVQHVSGVGTHFATDPEEVREVLERHDVVLLGLSKNYPDYSLPWVIANDLLTAVIGGRQMVPVVVDGDAVRPPRVGLAQAAHYDFAEIEAQPGTQIVFIVDGVPLGSKSRTDFLTKQIKSKPDARFILLTRDETHIIAESEFAAAANAQLHQLSNISFLEIAHFVEKNFGMTATEAEVVALRLNDTFRTFDLSAHPTYFAGISKEILAALLQANRRAELIQLAVDGFLTLVVAGDKASIALSRTTRARFLRTLARDLRVEKKTITRADLVDLARSYAEEYAFEVDPVAFVASFVDSGILHFSGDNAHFSLPFVEFYLLAVELADDSGTAVRYFDVDSNDFDLATFDLYCEIKPAPEVIERVLAGVEKGRRALALKEGERNILLTDSVRPAMLGRPERLDAIEKRFHKVAEDVRTGRGDVKRKQRLLDVADRIRETASDKSGLREGEEVPEPSEEARVFNDAVRCWVIATTMLGGGAEHLKGGIKQDLCAALIDMAAFLSHAWTEAYSRVDFDEIRREFTSDETVRSIQNGAGEPADIEETRRSLGSMIDLLEFSLLSAPLRRLLDQLCEKARLRVLATSVERAEVKGEVQRMMQAAWLADVEGGRGHKKLIEAIKELPASPFIRILIATHLLTRVYWNHWNKEDRVHLLDAAEIALKPFMTLKKGEIKRRIEQSV